MRITNSMMVNNSLANVAINKRQMSMLDTQLALEKKISRPSEDPVIAIRALRLRSSLNEVTQYLEKNIPDADSWLSVTQGAMEEAYDIIEDLYEYCNQGSTDTFATTERNTIATSLLQLKEAFYSQANVDYAGRYVFSGYRTDTPVTFMSGQAAQGKSYTITQEFNGRDITSKTVYTDIVDLADADDVLKFEDDIAMPGSQSIYRYNLGYAQISDANIQNIVYNGGADQIAISGVTTDTNAIPGDDEVLLNPSTGELLFGKNVYNTIKAQTDLSFTYDKDTFEKGDVKPEFYFTCIDKSEDVSDPSKWIEYVQDPLGQDIEYTVNFGQKLKINTEAKDAFNIQLGREVDQLAEAVQTVLDIEAKQEQIKEMLGSQNYQDDLSQKKLNAMLEASQKEWDLAHNTMQESFSAGITKMQNYMQQNTTANSDVGNRMIRLQLTESRLKEQQTNFKSLKSQNEDIELEEVVVRYSEAELVYDASLSAASKVVRQSLLDFLK